MVRLRCFDELDSTEGTVQLHDEADDGRLILHPRPNPDDPNDPLNWPRWKKHVCFGAVCAFTFLTNYAIGGLSPAFYGLGIEFGKTQTEVTALLLWPILVLGVFNFFWVPLANYFGKRPVFPSPGQAQRHSVQLDLYFLHERGNYLGLYMNAIAGGNTIGPLICGFVITSLSWRWHKWIAFILTAVNWIVVLMFVPETRYDRSYLETSPNPTLRSDTDRADASDEELGNGASAEKVISSNSRETPRHPALRCKQVPKKTWWQELSLWSGVPKDTNLFVMFIRPFPLIAYPPIIFAFLAYAVSLAWVVAINILNSFLLQAPPYSWKPSINGLINIPGLIGNIIGAIIGGWLVDKYSDRHSKKHNGVFQPESRLHLLWIAGIIVPAGCLVFGYGAQDSLNWTSLFFGYGMVAVGLTAVPVATMTYVSDCYLPVNADALLLVNGLKNIVAFGFLQGVVPWVTVAGYASTFGTQAGVYVAILLLALPLIFFGQRIRHASARWRLIL
ncbi:hypothetical protein LTR62_004595 [Meristemomyces frigidus]|uniref:Major facilitator superfamily (MFS) profile domain-containing protein n=1 Tax=Meristemomyces frigidus TaxID=1508187 RepID=A0AAN7YR94_9PEZI|nr:hypothetical protein LTR62_004595 [Meristemomyces frigidus]